MKPTVYSSPMAHPTSKNPATTRIAQFIASSFSMAQRVSGILVRLVRQSGVWRRGATPARCSIVDRQTVSPSHNFYLIVRMRAGSAMAVTRVPPGASSRPSSISQTVSQFFSHNSVKSFTVAGPCPAYYAASRIMPKPLMSSAPFPFHSCLSTHTDA